MRADGQGALMRAVLWEATKWSVIATLWVAALIASTGVLGPVG